MSDSEREFLTGILDVQSSRTRSWKLAFENFIVMWAATALIMIVAWLLVAWVLGLVFDWRIGLGSGSATWVVSLGVPACGVVAAASTVRWVKAWPDHRSELKEDLAKGVVSEERYRVSAVKRFQEPEHGGLIYFLRTTDSKTLVLYDSESQNLGAGGEDPLGSSFRPSEELVMVRAPATGFVVEKQLGGLPFPLPPPVELVVPVDKWPADEEFSDIPWDDLERRMGGASA